MKMKESIKQLLLALWLGLFLPGIILAAIRPQHLPQDTTASKSETITQEQMQVPVLDAEGNETVMELESYVLGVVLGEMPVDFEAEALKAQAVVARTYTLKRHLSADKHKQGAVCMDASCCQAYRSAERFLEQGGTQTQVEKVRKAVQDTADMVLYYENDLIEATYFSCSGGKTEEAAAVWGTDIPYLQAVDSPGEEQATRYMQTVQLTKDEFAEKLGLTLSELSGNCIGSITYTKGGGVDQMQVGTKLFSGTQIRQLLGLNSTAFVMSVVGDTVSITTKGFGHRVGMSQYGAEAMAVQGSDYAQILAYYYPGTQLRVFDKAEVF